MLEKRGSFLFFFFYVWLSIPPSTVLFFLLHAICIHFSFSLLGFFLCSYVRGGTSTKTTFSFFLRKHYLRIQVKIKIDFHMSLRLLKRLLSNLFKISFVGFFWSVFRLRMPFLHKKFPFVLLFSNTCIVLSWDDGSFPAFSSSSYSST